MSVRVRLCLRVKRTEKTALAVTATVCVWLRLCVHARARVWPCALAYACTQFWSQVGGLQSASGWAQGAATDKTWGQATAAGFGPCTALGFSVHIHRGPGGASIPHTQPPPHTQQPHAAQGRTTLGPSNTYRPPCWVVVSMEEGVIIV